MKRLFFVFLTILLFSQGLWAGEQGSPIIDFEDEDGRLSYSRSYWRPYRRFRISCFYDPDRSQGGCSILNPYVDRDIHCEGRATVRTASGWVFPGVWMNQVVYPRERAYSRVHIDGGRWGIGPVGAVTNVYWSSLRCDLE